MPVQLNLLETIEKEEKLTNLIKNGSSGFLRQYTGIDLKAQVMIDKYHVEMQIMELEKLLSKQLNFPPDIYHETIYEEVMREFDDYNFKKNR